MSGDDWQAGDRALCVNDTPNPVFGRTSACKGRIYTVSAVGPEKIHGLFGRSCSLLFDEIRSTVSLDGCFASRRFRKIHPHTPDAEDRETIALLTGKPAKVEG